MDRLARLFDWGKAWLSKNYLFWIASVLFCFTSSASALQLDVALDRNNVVPGSRILATITVANDSDVVESNLRVQLDYPEGLAGLAESIVSGPLNEAESCNQISRPGSCEQNERLVWDIDTLNPGQAVQFSLPPNVIDSAGIDAEIDIAANLLQGGSIVSSDAKVAIVNARAELLVSIDEDQDPVSANDSLTYNLRYGNLSSASVTESILSFPIPAGVEFVSATGGGSLADGVVTWNLGTLNAGQAGLLQVVTQVDATAGNGDLIEASASIAGASQTTFIETTQQAGSTIYVAGDQPLALDINVPERVAPGGSLPVEIVVSNTSSSPVVGGQVLLRHAIGLAFVGEGLVSGPFQASNSCAEVSRSGSCEANEFYRWNLGNLSPGQAVTLTVPMAVNSGASSGFLINLAPRLTTDGTTLINESRTVVVNSNTNLRLAIDESRDAVRAGEVVTYTLKYGNSGSSAISDASLHFTLPDEMTLIRASEGATMEGRSLVWDLGVIDGNAVGQRIVRLRASDTLESGALFEAQASLGGIDQSTLQSVAQASGSTAYSVNEQPLALALQVQDLPSRSGQSLTVAVTVENTSSAQVFGASALLRFPRLLNSLSESLITGPINDSLSCDERSFSTTCESDEFVIWNIGTLNPGQVIEAELPPSIAANIANGELTRFLVEVSEDSGTLNRASYTLVIDDADDSDNDGLGGVFDNCPEEANANQANFDLDAFGDVCDSDDDNDQLPDTFEITFGLNPFDAGDANEDPDGDGFVNLDEFLNGTDPNVADLPPVEPPQAVAGSDVTVIEGDLVTLDGSGSINTTSFTWSQVGGVDVELDEAASASPSFTAPAVNSQVELTFSLLAENESESDSDQVNVIVLPDLPPNANAGPDQPASGLEVRPGDLVTLNGASSTDTRGNEDTSSDLEFSWQQSGGDLSVTLDDATAAQSAFSAPNFGINGGTLTFTLTVTDIDGQTDTDTVLIQVTPLIPPVANAGPNASVLIGTEVTLNGANSADADGIIDSYNWEQISGPDVALINSTSVQASFTAPGEESSLEFLLTVIDSDGLESNDQVVVNVGVAPVAVCRAGPDVNVDEPVNSLGNDSITLDASGSTIESGSIASYLWTQIDGPDVTLTNANTATPSFMLPQVNQGGASLVFQVTCTSDLGTQSSDTLTVSVSDVNRAPIADAGADQTVLEGEVVSLDASTSSDPDADAIEYLWTIVSGPAVALSDPMVATPSFTAPEVGPQGSAIELEVTVMDSGTPVMSSTDRVIVNVSNVNQAPSAVIESIAPVAARSTVSLDASGSLDVDGTALTFNWVQTAGTQVTLQGADTATPSFQLPDVDVAGEVLTFEVVVSDGSLMSSAEIDVVVEHVVAAPQTTVALLDGFSQTIVPDAGEQIVLGFVVTSSELGNELRSITLQGSGELDEVTDVSQVRLYLDGNGDGEVEPAELLEMGEYQADDGELTLVLTNSIPLPEGSLSFLVTYEL